MKNAGSLFLICVLAISVLTAEAQELERRDTVAERNRPALDADGIPIGGSRLLPRLGFGFLYDDNIYADDNEKQDDTAYILSPAAQIKSESSRHRADIGAIADLARYSTYSTEDYSDLRLWALGKLKVRDGDFGAELRVSDLHEARTSPDAFRGVDPDDVKNIDLTTFQRNSLQASYTHNPGRWLAKVKGTYRTLDFDPTMTSSGDVSNADRDRSGLELGLRGGYSVTPDIAVFLEGLLEDIEYDQQFDRNGYERSSKGGEARLGTKLDLTGRTNGELYVGYLYRRYDDPRFSKTNGPSFGGEIVWNPTQLTSVSFVASRLIAPTTIVGSAGIVETNLGIGVDHELLRNVILSAEFSVKNDDFESIDRKDKASQVTLGGKYLMNRFIQIFVGYEYRNRDTSPSDSGGVDFRKNELFARVVGQI